MWQDAPAVGHAWLRVPRGCPSPHFWNHCVLTCDHLQRSELENMNFFGGIVILSHCSCFTLARLHPKLTSPRTDWLYHFVPRNSVSTHLSNSGELMCRRRRALAHKMLILLVHGEGVPLVQWDVQSHWSETRTNVRVVFTVSSKWGGFWSHFKITSTYSDGFPWSIQTPV